MAKKTKRPGAMSMQLEAPGPRYRPVMLSKPLNLNTLKEQLRSKAVTLGPDHPSLKLLKKQIVDMETGVVKGQREATKQGKTKAR